MKKLKLVLGVLVFTFLLNGCTLEGEDEKLIYRIENTTDHQVSLFFYNIDQEGQRNFAFKKEIDGKGLILEKKITALPGEAAIPDLYGANLVVVVFDNSRVEEHINGAPRENSILDYPFTYTVNGNTLTYEITQQNFENAIPCDGPCN